MTTQEKIKTSRSAGAVGANSTVIRYIKENLSTLGECSFLDFGCGPKGRHVAQLHQNLLAVWGEDLAFDHAGYSELTRRKRMGLPWDSSEFSEEVLSMPPWAHLEGKRYDVVYASNVLNVQGTYADIYNVMDTLKTRLNPGGLLLVNCTSKPWKNKDLTPQQVRQMLWDYYSMFPVAISSSGRDSIVWANWLDTDLPIIRHKINCKFLETVTTC